MVGAPVTEVRLSDMAKTALPTLMVSLSGAGLTIGRSGPCIYSVDEASSATPDDVLVEITAPTTIPYLVSHRNGHPARIGFGFQDMAFGQAILAELVRAKPDIAFGEPATAKILAMAARIARTDAPVLIAGETGTGKEGLARFVHAASARAGRPFVAINCAALPETMAEAMLFGHERGAFTGAHSANAGLFRAADGGSLLLDEVADLPLGLQAKLLRALQENEVLAVGALKPVQTDIRIIAAANRDLEAEVAQGRFRADLFWRLNVMSLELAPLRARRQDIRAIAASLLVRYARKNVSFAWPTAHALDQLMAHDWPGNVRELDSVLQRALLTCEEGRIDVSDLQITRRASIYDGTLRAVGRQSQTGAIQTALDQTQGHRANAARLLGVSERTLRYRMAELRAAA
jgi:two-component system, response regulator FlrC